MKKKSLSGFFVSYPSRPHPPTEKNYSLAENNDSLMPHTLELVQSYTVNDLILFGGHCDLYIMVQRFCLVSLTISKRKTSYRSLKQTASSTSCPWTTILVSRFSVNILSRVDCLV